MFLAKGFHGFVFGISHRAVFDGGKHRRADIAIIHGFRGRSKETPGEGKTRLDRHGGELGTILHDISNGINVRRGRLLVRRGYLPIAGMGRDAHVLQTELVRIGRPTDGDEDGIVLIDGIVREGHLNPTIGEFLELGRDHGVFEGHPMIGHVGSNLVRAFAIEPTEENRPDGNGGIIPQSSEEASAFERDVRCTDAEGLAGGMIEGENVIGGNGQVGTRTIEGRGAAPDGDEGACGRDGGDVALLIGDLEGVAIEECAEFVEVRDAVLAQVDAVFEVEGSDVVLDVGPHGVPRVIQRLLAIAIAAAIANSNSKRRGIGLHGFTNECGMVHELLGDAADIDAGATEAPGRPGRRGLDKVQHGDLGRPLLHGLFRSGQTATSPADDDEVVIIPVIGRVSILHHGDSDSHLIITRFVRGGTECPAVIEGIVASANEPQHVLGQRLGRGALAPPRKGGGGVGYSGRIRETIVVAKGYLVVGAFDEPFAVRVAVGEVVCDDLETGGE